MRNAEILRQLMSDYGLTQQQTANELMVSLVTVTSWLRPESNANYRPMPDRDIKFLECLLRPRKKID